MKRAFCLSVALAALALVAQAPAWAEEGDPIPCPITTTTSTGPNGETIVRRESCGGVEITTTGGSSQQTGGPVTTTTTQSGGGVTHTTNDDGSHTRTRDRSRSATTTTEGPGYTETRTRSRSSSTSVTTPSASDIVGAMPPVRAGGQGWSVEIGGSGGGRDDDDDFGGIPQPPPDFGRLVLFDNASFRGRSIGITQDTPNLGARRFSDVASAARVQAGVWEVCEEVNYGGRCIQLTSNTDLDAAGMGDTVASVRRVR